MSDDDYFTQNQEHHRQSPSHIECEAEPEDENVRPVCCVYTPDGWRSVDQYGQYLNPSPTKDKTPLHARIMAIGETRIQILEDKAKDAKMWPGVEYGKILTAIKEINILLDLIREVKI